MFLHDCYPHNLSCTRHSLLYQSNKHFHSYFCDRCQITRGNAAGFHRCTAQLRSDTCCCLTRRGCLSHLFRTIWNVLLFSSLSSRAACECSHVGDNCDASTGQCICPPNTIGERCDRCAPNHWGHDITTGCTVCWKNVFQITVASVSLQLYPNKMVHKKSQ